VSLFQDLIRSTDMIGSAAIYWEGRVGLESEVAQLRRGDLDALSALLTRYQNRLYRYLLRPGGGEDPAIRCQAEFRSLAFYRGAKYRV
jgi:hypothetical protein